jgi:hypothetical protein
VASSLIQLQAELSGLEIQARLHKIEDPISHIHPDVRELAREIYSALRSRGKWPLEMSAEFYARYSRPLAMLEAARHIDATHALGRRFAGGLWSNGPAFTLYMCALYEDPVKMDALVTRVDQAPPGMHLDGQALARELDLPPASVKAVFESFSDKGLGLTSPALRDFSYRAKA